MFKEFEPDKFAVQQCNTRCGKQQEVGLVEVTEAEWAANLGEARNVVSEDGPEFEGANLEL